MKSNKKSPKWKSNLKQTIMLKNALIEEGIDPKQCKIEIDHDRGYSYVNDVKLPIIFPRSYVSFAERCHIPTTHKKYKFYFNGNPGKRNARAELMEKFVNQKKSRLIFNNDGRLVENKEVPNAIYLEEMADSFFALCPHQPGWRGDWESLWTYRYIEALLLKTMPVQFRETPLAKTFTEESIFKWDDDSFDSIPTHKELDHNYKFALRKFTLPAYVGSL